MNHYLPAVTLSSFLNIPKTVYSSKKQVPALIGAEKNLSFKDNKELASAQTWPATNGVPALGMRIVALTLTNNTHETIEVKKSLNIAVGDYVKQPIDFSPPYLPEKQATEVYLMYQLLQQRLPKLSSKSSVQGSASLPSYSADQPLRSVFMASTKKRNFTRELKEVNLFHKSLSPGQTLSGLLLFPSASAAPLQFFLN